jgi:hypothetical protein
MTWTVWSGSAGCSSTLFSTSTVWKNSTATMIVGATR